MHIPLPIAILSCIAAFGIVWYLGTRDKEFIAPPTPEELVEVSTEWEKNRPNIPPPQPINAALLADTKPEQPITPATVNERPEEITVGNLDESPGLAAYGAHGDKGTDAMVALATLLETKGEFQRGLLAWERVIDTTEPDDEQRAVATTAINRLKTGLPPWNPDPSDEIVITLRAGATLKDKAILTKALEQAAETINQASGHILKVETKASIGKVRGKRPPRVPVAIWFSRQPKGSDTPAETPPISFMADPSQDKMLVAQIEAGVYALVRTHLKTNTSFSPLPEYPSGAKPADLLNLHITRLMWREFATSLKE